MQPYAPTPPHTHRLPTYPHCLRYAAKAQEARCILACTSPAFRQPMPVITVRVTPEQSSWIESQTRGYVKKADVVRGLIDRAISSQPYPFTPVAPSASIVGKGGRGVRVYSPLTNNPQGLEQPLEPLETAFRTPLYPLPEGKDSGVKGVQGEKGHHPSQNASRDDATNPDPIKPPRATLERHHVTASDVPDHLSAVTAELLGFWEQKSGRVTKRAWDSLLSEAAKILRDSRGGLDILRDELSMATQAGYRGLNHSRWLAYGLRKGTGASPGRRAAFEEDLSNHPAYKPFDAPWLHE